MGNLLVSCNAILRVSVCSRHKRHSNGRRRLLGRFQGTFFLCFCFAAHNNNTSNKLLIALFVFSLFVLQGDVFVPQSERQQRIEVDMAVGMGLSADVARLQRDR